MVGEAVTIYDCFIAVDEYQMIAARRAELADCGHEVVHVAVEDQTDHRGRAKPLYLSDQLGVQVHNSRTPAVGSTWEHEHYQRDYILNAVASNYPDDDDLIIAGDVDEIVRGSAIPRILAGTLQWRMKLGMRMHCWGPQWVDPSLWACALAFRWKDRPDSITTQRGTVYGVGHIVADAGWHLTWFGGKAATHQKLSTFTHNELDLPNYHERLDSTWPDEGLTINGYRLAPWDGSDMPRGVEW